MIGRKMGVSDGVFLPHSALLFLVVSLTLLVSLSCSHRERASDKEPAKKAAVNRTAGAMSLSVVLKSVESAGYVPVMEVEFEEDHWEIKAYRDGQLVQLKVGLLAGEILPNPSPPVGKPLSVILKDLEDQGYGPILDVERAGGSSSGYAWEIEAYKGNSEVTVSVEPDSGKISPK